MYQLLVEEVLLGLLLVEEDQLDWLLVQEDLFHQLVEEEDQLDWLLVQEDQLYQLVGENQLHQLVEEQDQLHLPGGGGSVTSVAGGPNLPRNNCNIVPGGGSIASS